MSTNRLRRYSPESLGLRIGPGRGGDSFAEQPDHHEVERREVGEAVATDLEPVGLGQERCGTARW